MAAPTASPGAAGDVPGGGGRSFQSRWLPAIAWGSLMFALSGVPSLGTGLGTWDLVLRKLAHAAEYGILAALLARALAPVPAFAAAVAFALSDELHQHFVPGRAAKPLDVAIDAAGALAGLLALRWARARGHRLASPRWTERISRIASSRRSSSGST